MLCTFTHMPTSVHAERDREGGRERQKQRETRTEIACLDAVYFMTISILPNFND